MALLAAWLLLLSLLSVPLEAGTITGQIQTPTGGAIANGTLSFALSQPALLSGTASLTQSAVSCYTDKSGNIVGLPDPLAQPILSVSTATGTLPAATYYVTIAYYTGATITNVSPEASIVLSSMGELLITPPVYQPSGATGIKIYVGTSSGSELLQVTTTSFTVAIIAAPLAGVTSPPSSNNTVCSLAFSDQLIPTGTYYTVGLVNKNGSPIAGFPQTWCTYGGAGGTINVSNGAPTGNCNVNGAFYPTPLFQSGFNGASTQSVGTNLTLGANLTLTSPFVASNQVNVTNPGIFTGLSMQQYAQSVVNGTNMGSELQNSCIGCTYEVDALAGGATAPPGTLAVGVNGVAGYCVSNADSRSGGVGPPGIIANCTAFFGHTRVTANGGAGWGFNPVVYDQNGVQHDSIVGSEYDLSVNGTPDTFGGIILLYGTHGAGAWPASATGLVLENVGTTPLPNGIVLGQNAAVGGLQLYPACAPTGSETCNSMPVFFRAANSGTQNESAIAGDPNGDVAVTPASGTAGLNVTQGNLFLGGSKGQHINTHLGNGDTTGVCTVASGTTCSIAFTTNYNSTPSCVVTPTSNAGAFYLSAQANSGFTITYASSGAQTFNYVCMGNPN